MVNDLRNLQTNYMPVLGPNVPFLVLYAKNEVAARIFRVYMPIFAGNSREDSHVEVKGLLVGKLIQTSKGDQCGCGSSLNRPLKEISVRSSSRLFFFFANFFMHSPKRYLNEHI